jgi:spermidine synthase
VEIQEGAQYLEFPIRRGRFAIRILVERTLVGLRSEFQRIEIFHTAAFGRTLFLDRHIQLTELDERAYHESLVHVPLLNTQNPRRVLVIGGGDGGVLREVLKHNTIQHVDLVEIDQEVIEVCRRHLPFLNEGVFEDARTEVSIRDAFDFVQEDHEPYDLIIVDATDVYEGEDGSLSEQLFTGPFYRRLLELLTENGFVVSQADNHIFCPYSLESIRANFKSAFPAVGSYFAVVPSFGGFSAFCWGSRGRSVSPKWPCPAGAGVDLAYLNEHSYNFGQSELPFMLE